MSSSSLLHITKKKADVQCKHSFMRGPRKKNRAEEKHEEIKTEDSSELYNISLDKKKTSHSDIV